MADVRRGDAAAPGEREGSRAAPAPGGAPRQTVVKVCGLTRIEDARASIEAGADWLGFIVWRESPRAIDPEAAAAIVSALAIRNAVAVMVSPTPDQALATARRVGAHRVQLHRVAPGLWPGDFPLPVTFALTVDEQSRLSHALPDHPHVLMLDTADAHLAGGTGRTFGWDAAIAIARTRRVMLAGGLDAGNVGDAIRRVSPYGVDASSRLEASPGIKDHDRVRRFVAAVRQVDTTVGA